METNENKGGMESQQFATDWSPEAIDKKNSQVDALIQRIAAAEKNALTGNYPDGDPDDLRGDFNDLLHNLCGGIINSQSADFNQKAKERLDKAVDEALKQR